MANRANIALELIKRECQMAMSAQHKAALVQGRTEARAIRAYLDALGSRKPGRPVTPVSLENRIAALQAKIDDEDNALRRVTLLQSRIELERSLAEAETSIDLTELEAGFVESAAAYSERKGITYPAWRQAGVPASVLKEAGIPRTRS
ncbi:MAG TPA: hypothetical protein VID03_07875 [Acidimicrobiia bacterium]